MSQKNIIIIALVVLLAGGIGVLFYYNSNSAKLSRAEKWLNNNTVDEAPNLPTETVVPSPTTVAIASEKYPIKPGIETYPDSVKTGFMGSCVTPKSNTAYCECAFDWIQKRFTLTEFVAISQKVTAKEVPDELMQAVAACASHLLK